MKLADYRVRYDGREADEHKLDLRDLADSLQGVARIVEVAGHFSLTGDLKTRGRSDSVKVLIAATDAHCFDVSLVLEWAKQLGVFSGSIGALLTAVVAYILHKRTKRPDAEVQHLRELLEIAIGKLAEERGGQGGQAEEIARLLETVDRMVDALAPAMRRAVQPIGSSCNTIQFGDGDASAVLDQTDKEVLTQESIEVGDEQDHDILLSELDVENATCKFSFADEPDSSSRWRGVLADPQIVKPDNPYLRAFSARKPVSVRGKALMKDGEFHQLHISDISPAFPD